MSRYPEPLEKSDILFELGDWMILSTEKLAGFRKQGSVIGHRCKQFKDDEAVQFLDEEDALAGVCWWCRVEVVEEVQALWQLQNADRIPEMNRYTAQEQAKCNEPLTKPDKLLNQKRDTERVETDSVSKLKQHGMIFTLDKAYWGRYDWRRNWKKAIYEESGPKRRQS